VRALNPTSGDDSVTSDSGGDGSNLNFIASDVGGGEPFCCSGDGGSR